MKNIRLLAFFVLTILAITSSVVFAQSWKNIFPKPSGFTTCVAYNPLSQGKIIYTFVMGSSSLQPIRCARSDDGGATWSLYTIEKKFGTLIHQLYCLEADTNIVFAIGDSVFRSLDGGKTWAGVLAIPSQDGETLSYHKASNTLYFVGTDTLSGSKSFSTWVSTDRGATWTQRQGLSGDGMICTIAASSSTQPTLLVGSAGGNIIRSIDNGINWQTVLPTVDVGCEISKIIFSDAAPHTAFAACWKSKYRTVVVSTDDGLTWADLNADTVWTWAIEIDPDPIKIKNGMPQHFWTGLLWTGRSENSVVAETTDGGASWKQYPFTAKNRGVWVLKYDTTSKVLLASSSDGIFALQTNADVRNISTPDHSVFLTSDANNTNTTIHFPSSPITQLQLFDILGREIYSTTMFNASSFDLRNSDFKNGSYIIKISNKNGVVGIAKWLCRG